MNLLKPLLSTTLAKLKYHLDQSNRALWLPVSAALLVTMFFLITIFQAEPGTYVDELGFTGQDDDVVIDDLSESNKPIVEKKTVQPGESIYTILTANGLTPGDVEETAKQLKSSFSIRKFRPGQHYEIEKSSTGRLLRFTYFQDPMMTVHIERDTATGSMKVRREAKEYETRLAFIEGSVSTTLSSELATRNRSELIRPMKKLFRGRVNFIRDIRPGSGFRVLYEEKWLDDEYISTGRVLAAELSANKKVYTAYRYTDSKGKTAYYDEKGNTLEPHSKSIKQFIQPCNYSRISSGFGYRIHPIRRTRHFHGGVDMAARTGTPVKAAADGTVIFRGVKGGAGNMVTLKHDGGYHTQYLHLSRYAPVARNGAKIRQGEIIGYVGSTGTSTGPHLDFRVIHNGKPLNPLVALASSKEEPAAGLSKQEKNALLAEISALKTQLDNSRTFIATRTKRADRLL